MIRKIFISLVFLISLISNSYAAGSSSSGNSSNSQTKNLSEFDWAERNILKAKKQEKKGKLDKAKKFYKKALVNLEKANKADPANPDILNYLGFTERKLGNYKESEIYYLVGLELDPEHFGINEYLGELYVTTNRIDLAKERLKVLEKCNCEQYNELNAVIKGTKKSKY